MAFHRSTLPEDGFRLRMAAFYAAIFAFAGVQMPFLPVWLSAKGLDSREIGLVLASATLVRPVVVPLATRVVDRFGWSRGSLVAAAWAACASFVLVALGDGFAAIIAAFTISALPQALVLPLADAYALRGLAERGRTYGPVRLWGSVAFIAASLAGGLALERLGAANLIWVLVAALAATAAAASLLAPLGPHRVDAAAPRSEATAPWRSRAFVAVVAAASLVQASHAVYYGFASLQWAAKGLDGASIGALWAIGVAVEIALFAVSGRIMMRVRALDMIALGALGAALRWAAMAFDPPTALLPFLQCLHALSFGATHLGAMHVLASFASAQRGATAQGDYSAIVAIVLAGAMGLAGALVAAFGSYAYLAMAASALGGGAIVALARGADLA
jgi:PPP family 3-phenylpropionic acid transporter